MRSVWIGTAGFVGAVARYHVDGLFDRHSRSDFPWGVLVVNVSGCFVLGVLVTLFARRFVVSEDLRLALTVGLLGAYTTFSTFAYQVLRLAEDGRAGVAAAYVATSVVAGVGAAWLGTALARLA